jgi:hypothetical protein
MKRKVRLFVLVLTVVSLLIHMLGPTIPSTKASLPDGLCMASCIA